VSFEQRLRDAALAVVAEHGLAGLTMARLAERLGGSRMTLHRRGFGRDDVVALLAAHAADEYLRAVWPALTATGSGRERLEQALRALCAVADRYAPLLVGLYADDGGIFHEVDAAEAGAPEPDRVVATRRVFVAPLARLLRDGDADGTLRLRGPDPDSTATVVFNQVGWTYLALRVGQRWPADRATDAVVDLALNGLATAPAQPARDQARPARPAASSR